MLSKHFGAFLNIILLVKNKEYKYFFRKFVIKGKNGKN